jgi:probable F420-dependent oxidoreductase
VAAPRPFRFGVTAPTVESGGGWTDRARRVEHLGYSTLSVPDHFRNQLASVPALAAAALATTRLRLGSLVFCNDFHHPVMLAREAATIDVLSGGRLELGLGAGWLRAEYEEAGIRFDDARTRIERLAEAVTIIKGLLAGEPVTFSGRHYTVANLAGSATVQRPHPPILVGGGGRRTLALAGREASIVGFGFPATSCSRLPTCCWGRSTRSARRYAYGGSGTGSPISPCSSETWRPSRRWWRDSPAPDHPSPCPLP